MWKERNNRIFDNKAVDCDELVDLIKTGMGIRSEGRLNINDYSVEDFKRYLDRIRMIKI